MAVRCMVHGRSYKARNLQIGVQAGFESQHGHHAGLSVWWRRFSYKEDQWSSIPHPGTMGPYHWWKWTCLLSRTQ